MFSKHKSKWFSAALLAFTLLQGMLPQFAAELTPLWYAGISLFIGVVVTVLGRLKHATGGFLYRNKLTIVGVAVIIFSVVQGVASQFEPLLSPLGFKIFTAVVGVLVGILGIINSADETPPAPPPPEQGG